MAPKTKLTEKQKADIRAAKQKDPAVTNVALAKRFKVDPSRISRVLHGKESDAATAPPRAEGPEGLTGLRWDQIARADYNPRQRFDDSEIAALADSIATDGLLQNLVVRPDPTRDCYELVGGERRHRAIELLIADGRWPADRQLPCRVVEADLSSAHALALLENLQRVDLSPMEEARAFRALQDIDAEAWTPQSIARRIGRTDRHVQLRLNLLDKLTPEAQDALEDGTIQLAQARAMAGAPAALQKKALKGIANGEWSYRTAEDVHDEIRRNLVPASAALFDPEKVSVEVIEDAEGERWIEREAFSKAQKKAIDAKAAELKKKGWAWVEVGSYLPSYKIEDKRSKDKSKAGCFIEANQYRPQDGVKVHQGLVLKANDNDGDSAAARQAEREAQEQARQRHLDDIAAFRQALYERLRKAPEMAQRVLIAYLAGSINTLMEPYDADAGTFRATGDLWAAIRKPYECDEIDEDEVTAAALTAIDLPKARTGEVLAALVADLAFIPGPYAWRRGGLEKDNPALYLACTGLGIAIPDSIAKGNATDDDASDDDSGEDPDGDDDQEGAGQDGDPGEDAEPATTAAAPANLRDGTDPAEIDAVNAGLERHAERRSAGEQAEREAAEAAAGNADPLEIPAFLRRQKAADTAAGAGR